MLRIRRILRLEKPLNRSSNPTLKGGRNPSPNQYSPCSACDGPTLVALKLDNLLTQSGLCEVTSISSVSSFSCSGAS